MGTASKVLDEAIVQFLRNAAVEGETLESLITDVFTETYEDAPGPLLGQLALLVMQRMGVKHVLSDALLSSLHGAATQGKNIYSHIDTLERSIKRKRLPLPRSKQNLKLVGYATL